MNRDWCKLWIARSWVGLFRLGLLLTVWAEILCPVVCIPCWLCAQVVFGECKRILISNICEVLLKHMMLSGSVLLWLMRTKIVLLRCELVYFIPMIWKSLHLLYYCDETVVALADYISVKERELFVLTILVVIMLFFGYNWWGAHGCKPARADLIRTIVWLRLKPCESPLCVDLIIAGLFYYLLSLRVRKPGSSTLPYCFGWDFDLHKQVTTERASSIGVCWKIFTSEPGSGPLKPTNGSVVGTRRI